MIPLISDLLILEGARPHAHSTHNVHKFPKSWMPQSIEGETILLIPSNPQELRSKEGCLSIMRGDNEGFWYVWDVMFEVGMQDWPKNL